MTEKKKTELMLMLLLFAIAKLLFWLIGED